MEALGGEEYSSYSFITWALDGFKWSASRPGRALPPGEMTPGTHCTGGWVGPRAGLDTEATGKILCPCRESNLYRLVVLSVTRHYTDWTTPASIKYEVPSSFLNSVTVLPLCILGRHTSWPHRHICTYTDYCAWSNCVNNTEVFLELDIYLTGQEICGCCCCYRTSRFTKARHRTMYGATWIQSTLLFPAPLKPLLIYSDIKLGLPSGFFSSYLPTTILHGLTTSLTESTSNAQRILCYLMTITTLGEEYKVKLSCYAMQEPRWREVIASTHSWPRH
jgi:hypothetical protein